MKRLYFNLCMCLSPFFCGLIEYELKGFIFFPDSVVLVPKLFSLTIGKICKFEIIVIPTPHDNGEE